MAKKKSYDAYLRQQLGELIDQLQLTDLDKQSLKDRWLDQMVWADKKASQCQKSYYRLRLTTVVGGVLLPALVGISLQLGQNSKFFRVWFPPLTFALSQVIAVSVAIEEFCKFGDRWRDYRKMAEELKSEGWQYLQSSGPYELTGSHEQGYAQFANRVETIIKSDVQSYISNLMQQQAKQEAQAQNVLVQAQSAANNKTLIGYMNPNYPDPQTPSSGYPGAASATYPGAPAQPGYPPAPGYPAASGYPPSGYAPTPSYPAPAVPSAPSNGQPIPMMAQVAVAPPAAPAIPAATIPTPTIAPPSVPMSTPPPAPQPSHSGANLNAAIVAAANSLKGMSTVEGPDGGNNACAWTVNRVLQKAGIPALGENPNYVPELLRALQTGRGQPVSAAESKAGDLVIACGEAHIGIAMNDGCHTVLSNSSSHKCFAWESDVNFDGYYGGPSTIYRLLR